MSRKQYIPPNLDGNYVESDSEFGILSPIKAINSIRNPSFEMGMTYWAPISGSDTILFGQGKDSLLAPIPGSNGIRQGFQSHIGPTGETGNTAISYVYFWAIGGGGSATVRVRDSSLNLITSRTVSTTSRWQRFSLTFSSTTSTTFIDFLSTGNARIDDVVVLDTPCDYYLTHPAAGVLSIPGVENYDFKDPRDLAYTAKIRLFKEFGARVTSVVGLGYDAPQVNTVQLTSGKTVFLNSVPVAKDFSITCRIQGRPEQIDRYKADLIKELSANPELPKVLLNVRKDCLPGAEDLGEAGLIIAAFKGGTGIERTERTTENLSLDFTQIDPQIYFGADAYTIPISQSIRRFDNATLPTTHVTNRVVWRRKGEPWRTFSNASGFTSEVYANGFASTGDISRYCIESGEGDVFIWGPWATAYAIFRGNAAGNKYLLRFSRSGNTVAYPIGASSLAGIRGATQLPNGDILFYGEFEVNTNAFRSMAIYRQNEGQLVSVADFTKPGGGTPDINSARESEGRIFFTTFSTLAVNGSVVVSSVIAANKSVFVTLDNFRTVQQVFSGSSENVSSSISSIRVRKAGGVIWWVENFNINQGAGTIAFTANVFQERSGFGGGLLDTAALVNFKNVYSIKGRIGNDPFGASFLSALETKECLVVLLEACMSPSYSSTMEFYPSGKVSGLNFGTTATSSVQLQDGAAFFPPLSSFTIANMPYMGLLEYSPGPRISSLEAHYGHRGKEVDIGVMPGYLMATGDYADNGNSTVVEIESKNHGMVTPIFEFVGGFSDFRPVTIFNETNGSKVSFTGLLRAGQVTRFKTDQIANPPGLSVVENTGPNGYFQLSPGKNVLVSRFAYRLDTPTTYRPTILNVDGLTPHNFPNRAVRISDASNILSISRAVGALWVSLSDGSATGTNQYITMTATGLGGTNVSGQAFRTSAYTYFGFLPSATIIIPRSGLTIEAGTY